MAKTSVSADQLLDELGPLLKETLEELKTFQTPEEGFFFAWRLIDDILQHLGNRYEKNEVIYQVFEKLRSVNATHILKYQGETLREMGKLRSEVLHGEITERLNQIEDEEDVDLSSVKRRVPELATMLVKNHGMDLVEKAVKARLLE